MNASVESNLWQNKQNDDLVMIQWFHGWLNDHSIKCVKKIGMQTVREVFNFSLIFFLFIPYFKIIQDGLSSQMFKKEKKREKAKYTVKDEISSYFEIRCYC